MSDDLTAKLNSYFEDDAPVKVRVLDLFAPFARVQDDEGDGKLAEVGVTTKQWANAEVGRYQNKTNESTYLADSKTQEGGEPAGNSTRDHVIYRGQSRACCVCDRSRQSYL